MSETGQQKGIEGDKPVAAVQKAKTNNPETPMDDQKASRDVVVNPPDLESGIAARDSPKVNVEPGNMTATETEAPAETKQESPAPVVQDIGTTGFPSTIPNEKLEDPKLAMLASVKAAQQELGHSLASTEASPRERQPHAKGKELKCKSCMCCNDERIPVAIFQPMEGGRSMAIKFSPKCGHACTIVINSAFEITEHVCTSCIEREADKGADSDFDFDRFIAGNEDLDGFLLKQKTRQAGKLVTLEDQMKVAVKKLVKPLAILVPTAVQKKSESQLRAEREDRLRQILEVEANLVYLRVLEFEKAATGSISYPIDKLSKMLKDLDKKYITGFIHKVNNDFLISYSEQTQTVRFYSPSKPEVEILSREFEKWLRFNRL
jgi:hypothetical protein